MGRDVDPGDVIWIRLYAAMSELVPGRVMVLPSGAAMTVREMRQWGRVWSSEVGNRNPQGGKRTQGPHLTGLGAT